MTIFNLLNCPSGPGITANKLLAVQLDKETLEYILSALINAHKYQ
jgi:hypothetical protein